IDVFEPDVRIDKKVTDRFGNNMYLGTVAPGDTLTYRITVYNIGSDTAINSFITDSIPKESSFVPGSVRYVFGPNSGVKTDASADDQSDYDAVNGKLKFRVGTGANGTTGGKIGNSSTGVDSTVITYKVTASNDCMVLKCNNLIANRGYVTTTGKISGNTITNGSNPAAFDGFGCPISGSTDTYINVSLASCSFPPDTTIASMCPATQYLASLYTRPGYTEFFNSSFSSVITAATIGTYYAVRTSATGCKDTVAITVSATMCTPPNVGNDCGVTAVNTAQTGNMGTNNYFPPGYSSTYFNTVPVKNASNGTFSINSSGAYTYNPNTNFTGLDTVVVSYCGVPSVPGPDLCFNDTLFMTVIGNPVVNKDSATTTQDAFVTGNILTNNSHPNGGTFTATTSPLVKNPSNGVIDVMSNGDFTYTPNPGLTGRDTVVVNVCAKVAIHSCTIDTVTMCKNDTLILIVNAGVVTGGGDAGVESKTLGNVIATRLYGNAVNSFVATTAPFVKSINTQVNGPTDLRLVDLAPSAVLYSTKSTVTTPTDLINFTNAVDVLAVDYSSASNTNAVFFGTKTLGDAYNHTKQICDRLKGAELLEVKVLSVNDYSVLAYKIKQRNGLIEFAANMNFGVKATSPFITLQSSWFTNNITPSEQLYNVQLWGASEIILSNLVRSVIDNANKFGSISVLNESTTIPETYITKGKRQNTNVVLSVKTNGTTTGYFELKEKQNETSTELVRQIPFTANN
ncbi:MAG: Ig-like domain-containing protein, partial [Dolichospermum sp.]